MSSAVDGGGPGPPPDLPPGHHQLTNGLPLRTHPQQQLTQVPHLPDQTLLPAGPLANPRFLYCPSAPSPPHRYPGTSSPVPQHPPYPPPPYTASPYPGYPYPVAMAYPPPYTYHQATGAPPGGAGDKYGYPPVTGPGGQFYPDHPGEIRPQHQALVCTCQHPPASSAAPGYPLPDDDGLYTAPPPQMAPLAALDPGPCDPPTSAGPVPAPPTRRSTSRGSLHSNFSEDSLVDEDGVAVPASTSAASSTAAAVASPAPAQPAVVMRNKPVNRQPEKRRSLTQEYLAAQAEAGSRRSSQNLDKPASSPASAADAATASPAESRPAGSPPGALASPSACPAETQPQLESRRLPQTQDSSNAAELRRLSQAYDERRPVSSAVEIRRMSQSYEQRPPATEPPRRYSAAFDERTAAGLAEPRGSYPPRGQPQPYDDRGQAPVELRRRSLAYDDRSNPVDPRRLSYCYDDRPAGAYVEPRRISQNYDERPVTSSVDPRRVSQSYDDRPAVSSTEKRRLSQSYDDRPAVSLIDPRRVSQTYDDRPATSSTEARRMSQSYDDRPAVAAPDPRRLSQAYDDRPVVSLEGRRTSQSYDDRPTVSASERRRLSQVYDGGTTGAVAPPDGDGDSLRTGAAEPTPSSRSSEPAAGDSAADTGADDDKPACQKYDERPCAVTVDHPSAAPKPWWEREPEKTPPAKASSRDSSSRRSSVDKTAKSAMQLPRKTSGGGADVTAGSPERQDLATGDTSSNTSPLAFTVDFGTADDKKLHVRDSISKWAPRPRRPLSGANRDDKEEARSDGGDTKVAGSGLARPRSLLRRRPGAIGYQSEGYFSSDQDVDTNANPTREGKKTMSRSAEQAVPKSSLKSRTPSPRGTSATRTGSSRRAGSSSKTPPTGGGLKKSATVGNMPSSSSARQLTAARSADTAGDVRDDVSEAGTYTIENEPEGEGEVDVAEVTREIDAAFSGLDVYDEPAVIDRPGGGDSSSKEGSPDRDTETSSKPSAYSSGSNWIEQWAAEVTKHNQENLRKAAAAQKAGAAGKPPSGSSGGGASPWPRGALSPDGGGSAGRPRRLLPTPPGLSSRSPPAAGSTTPADKARLEAGEDERTRTGRRQRHHSTDNTDTSSEASGQQPGGAPAALPTAPQQQPEFKFNRALSLRRARLGLDDGPPAPPPGASGAAKRPTPPPGRPSSGSGRKLSDSESKGSAASFARTDGGRFSLRMANGNAKTTPPSGKRGGSARRAGGSGGGSAAKTAAEAAKAARDQEMANWKRRKNYDPLKAAREDRQRRLERKTGGSQSDTACSLGGPLRSASFHGTDGFGASVLRRGTFTTSEDEGRQGRPPPPPPLSGRLSRPPLLHTAAVAAAEDSDLSEPLHEDTGSASSSTRKVSLDSSARRLPLSRGQVAPSLKNKVKLEALDNLVISTIHTLSSKIRGNAESLVTKLRCQFDEEDVRHTLLDDVLTTLTTDTPSSSKSSSRDLAGILKNLRKVEQTVQVLEQVLCDDECDVSDGEDLDTDKFGDGFY